MGAEVGDGIEFFSFPLPWISLKIRPLTSVRTVVVKGINSLKENLMVALNRTCSQVLEVTSAAGLCVMPLFRALPVT